MTTGISTDSLPQFSDDRRYSHASENPTPIPLEDRSAVLELLKEYYEAVDVNPRTLSEASGTTAPPRSDASMGTSISDMTFSFSTNNEPTQPEPARRKLDNVQRTRKALLRRLRACRKDCNRRKVKCKLHHHALHDLLEIGHTPYDKMVVEWAIRYDADSHLSPPSARVTSFAAGDDIEERHVVVNHANGVFHLSPNPPMLYGSSIDVDESIASLLDPSENVQHFSPPRENAIDSATSIPDIYITSRDNYMFPLGYRVPVLEPAHYRCCECSEIQPRQVLITHYYNMHSPFEQLNDPLRMVCPGCNKFYHYSNDLCWKCNIPRGGLTEWLYGRRFRNTMIFGQQPESSIVNYGCSPFWPSSNHGNNHHQYQDSNSPPQNSSFGNGGNYSFPGSPGSTYYSKLRLVISQYKQGFYASRILPRRLFRFYRYRKYAAVLAVITAVSSILGYTKHNWILSKAIQLTRGVPAVSPSKLPLIGVVLASVAFVLHRILVHANRANSIRSGWLSRCALKMFNVACGRRPLEGPAAAYQLGHSRS